MGHLVDIGLSPGYVAPGEYSPAALIELGRAEGKASMTLPAHDLATALYLMNERALFASFTDEQPSIPPERLLDTLVHIWVSSIYLETQ